jgi:transposase InsO family protein
MAMGKRRRDAQQPSMWAAMQDLPRRAHPFYARARLRDECLNLYSFESIPHARAVISAWRDDYKHHRPHGALGHLTPSEYAERRQPPTREVVALQLDPVW